jgi:hypothetical protein
MEQFNKALSFILGLIVVAVFIVVASGKFNLKGLSFSNTKTTAKTTPTVTPNVTPKPTSKPWFSFNQPTVKPTAKPTPKPTAVPKTTTKNGSVFSPVSQTNPNYHSYSGTSAPTSIPNTGVPIVLFPLFGTSLLTGIFMKKSGKRD